MQKTEVNDKTSINLKMAATVMVVVCGALVGIIKATHSRDLMEKDLKRQHDTHMLELNALRKRVEYLTTTRWRSLDDLLYMREFCELNNLDMPPKHKGLTYE